jgi:hypothetical protein
LGRIRIQPFILGKEEVMLCSNVVDIVLENCYENIIHEELLPTDIGQCNFTTENTLQLLIPSSSIRCNYGVPTDVTVSGTTLTWECLPIGEGEITDSCSANYLTQLIFYANFSDPLPPTFTVSEAVKSLTGGYSNTPAYIYDGVNDNIAVTGTGVSSLNGKRLLTVCAWVNLST